MNPPLETFTNCFQGLLPAQLFTCSLDGYCKTSQPLL
jgi:hypothetical protein